MSRNARSIPLGALMLLVSLSAASAQMIDLKLGHSDLVRTDQPAETVIVGNDQIANATIAAEGTIVVTGHALGSTNLILLDETGAEISSATVRVVPVDPRPRRAVRLILGGANEDVTVYVCGPEPGCVASASGGENEPAPSGTSEGAATVPTAGIDNQEQLGPVR